MQTSDEDRQKVLVLHGEGHGIREISRRTGRAVNTVRKIVQDADLRPPTEAELDEADRLLRTIARTPHLRARLKGLVR